jgi:hypothetical protein
MGLTINDTITLKNGMTVTGAYLSFNKQNIGLIPGPSARLVTPNVTSNIANVYDTAQYTACGMYKIWVNEDAKNSNCDPIQTGTVDYGISTEKTSTSLHGLLYEYIKTNIYTNTTDC